MRKAILFFSLVTFTSMVAATLPTPAAATDARQAIGMCDARGSDCSMKTNEHGDTTLCVKNTGGTECVICPLQGNCVVANKGGSKGKGGAVGSVFTGAKGPVGNQPAKGTQPVAGGVKPPTTAINSSGGKSDTTPHTNDSQHSSGGSHK
jgi:hypothetical protein